MLDAVALDGDALDGDAWMQVTYGDKYSIILHFIVQVSL